jgi:hypothetical protein
MPPLKSRTWAKVQADGTIKTGNRPSYANFKIRVGLKPIRDLRGPGAGGHMLDAIRINYLDDKRAGFSITTEPSRTKAKANEKRAPWWGWSAASVAALGKFAGDIYQTGLVDYLVSVGLSSANVVAGAGRRILRRAA